VYALGESSSWRRSSSGGRARRVVRDSVGGAGAAVEEEGGEAEPRAGLVEREETGGVGPPERGFEAAYRSHEVASVLSLVDTREKQQGEEEQKRREDLAIGPTCQARPIGSLCW
jgi:hypothetical protein